MSYEDELEQRGVWASPSGRAKLFILQNKNGDFMLQDWWRDGTEWKYRGEYGVPHEALVEWFGAEAVARLEKGEE